MVLTMARQDAEWGNVAILQRGADFPQQKYIWQKNYLLLGGERQPDQSRVSSGAVGIDGYRAVSFASDKPRKSGKPPFPC
jgi:hypothetical protein